MITIQNLFGKDNSFREQLGELSSHYRFGYSITSKIIKTWLRKTLFHFDEIVYNLKEKWAEGREREAIMMIMTIGKTFM